MTVQRIERTEVLTHAVEILGLDPETIGLVSTEGLCASVRRAASFLCPASPRQIVEAVLDAISPISNGIERSEVVDALAALVATGDLLELRQGPGQPRLLYLGPPSFVEKHPGEYLLLGIRPRAAVLVVEADANLEIIYDAHTRSVLTDRATGVATLMNAGLHRLSKDHWIRAPRRESSAKVIEKVHEQFNADCAAPGPISGLTIIAPDQPVHFYKGRWREPRSDDNGVYIGRRPQAYGAPIWCAVQIVKGTPQVVLDLPVDSSVTPAWDEARRIQAAIDVENGTPQVYRVRVCDQPRAGTYFDFFTPLPSWAERFITISGQPASKGRKSLFSYCLPNEAVDETQRFLMESLWMKPLKEDQEI